MIFLTVPLRRENLVFFTMRLTDSLSSFKTGLGDTGLEEELVMKGTFIT